MKTKRIVRGCIITVALAMGLYGAYIVETRETTNDVNLFQLVSAIWAMIAVSVSATVSLIALIAWAFSGEGK